MRGCHPSSMRSEHSLQLARRRCWGEGVPRAGPVGNAIPPSWLPGVGPGVSSLRSPGSGEAGFPSPLQTAWHTPAVPCHLLPEISPRDRSPRTLRPRLLLTPSRESPVVFARPGQARGAPSLCTLLLEGGHWMGPWICRLVDSVRVHGQRVMWGWLPASTSKPPELL